MYMHAVVRQRMRTQMNHHLCGPPTDRCLAMSGVGKPRGRPCRAQIAFFSAATGKAFTTVLAFIAATVTTLPNISRLPAWVAGFTRVLIMQMPGMVHFPAFFTSLVATLLRLSRTLDTSDFFNSVSSASAWAKAPLVKAFPCFIPAFIALIAFIGAMAGPRRALNTQTP